MAFTPRRGADGLLKITGSGTAEELFRVCSAVAAEYHLRSPELLTSPGLVKNFLFSYFRGKPDQSKEYFVVCWLDTQNVLLGTDTLFEGTIDSCAVYKRELVKRALEVGAAHVILAHNHPSGSTQPSPADFQITREIVNALRVVDIRVLDHVVVTPGGESHSFAEHGEI